MPPEISVVTPTLGRPEEVRELLGSLSLQTCLPREVVLVDGAAKVDDRTRHVCDEMESRLTYRLVYLRRGGGTALQRNAGIDVAEEGFIAFVDDDIRLERDFFERMIEVFEGDTEGGIGGVTGYITNQHLDPSTSRRWRWYRRLRLFTTYEPGRYDYATGYPINRYLQPPHEGLREIDFMGAGCAVWRREVFDSGLRFSTFFTGHGVLEDAHLALRAGRRWRLLENGRARAVHLRSPGARSDMRRLGRVSAVNYRFVFVDLLPERTVRQELRFWRVQLVDLASFAAAFVRRPSRGGAALVLGKLEGLWKALRLRGKGKDNE